MASVAITKPVTLDGWLSVVMLCLACLSAAILFLDIHIFVKTPHQIISQPALGELDDLRGHVRRRPAHFLAWDDAGSGESFFLKDYVFTDSGAGATLRFDDKTVVELGENTLLAIERVGDSSSLNIINGTLRLVQDERSRPLEVTMGEAKTLVKTDAGTSLNLKISKKDGAAVTVLRGGARLVGATGAQESVVKPQQVATWSAKALSQSDTSAAAEYPSVASLPVKLIGPTHGVQMQGDGPRDVIMIWEGSRVAASAKIEIAGDPEFKNILQTVDVVVRVAKDQATVHFEQSGVYYWRIVSRETAESSPQVSEERRLAIIFAAPPRLYIPVAEQIVSDSPHFSWEAQTSTTSNMPESYEIQISAEDAFAKVLTSAKTTGPSWATSKLGPGEFYWRVRRLSSDRWSPAQRFKIVMAATPAALEQAVQERIPTETTPLPSPTKKTPLKAPSLPKKIEIQLPAVRPSQMQHPTKSIWPQWRQLFESTAYAEEVSPSQHATIKWPAIEGAKSYDIQLSKDAGFSELVLSRHVNMPELVLEGLAPGDYYLRIAAIDDSGERGEFSEASIVTVVGPKKSQQLLSSRLLSPDSDASMVVKGEPVVSFRWEAVGGAAAYFLQVSRDASFKLLAFEKRSRGLDANATLSQLGEYYWRVKALASTTATADADSKWSEVRKFTLAMENPAVEPMKPPAVISRPPPEKKEPPVTITPVLVDPRRNHLHLFFAPTLLSYKSSGHTTHTAPTKLSASLFNSYRFAWTRWLSQNTGFDLEGQRFATQLFREPKDRDPPDQKSLDLQGYRIAALGRWRRMPSTAARYWDWRLGYGLVQSARFERQDSRSPVDLELIKGHGPAAGFGGGLRLGSSWWLKADAAYLYGIAMTADVGAMQDVNANLLLEQDLSEKSFGLVTGVSVEQLNMKFETGGAARALSTSLLLGFEYRR